MTSLVITPEKTNRLITEAEEIQIIDYRVKKGTLNVVPN